MNKVEGCDKAEGGGGGGVVVCSDCYPRGLVWWAFIEASLL